MQYPKLKVGDTIFFKNRGFSVCKIPPEDIPLIITEITTGSPSIANELYIKVKSLKGKDEWGWINDEDIVSLSQIRKEKLKKLNEIS